MLKRLTLATQQQPIKPGVDSWLTRPFGSDVGPATGEAPLGLRSLIICLGEKVEGSSKVTTFGSKIKAINHVGARAERGRSRMAKEIRLKLEGPI
jgi:hypothetical protein